MLEIMIEMDIKKSSDKNQQLFSFVSSFFLVTFVAMVIIILMYPAENYEMYIWKRNETVKYFGYICNRLRRCLKKLMFLVLNSVTIKCRK